MFARAATATTATFARLLTAMWAGGLACIGAMAAPAAFATLNPAQAAGFVARLFRQEAYASLGIAVLLLVIERQRSRAFMNVPEDSGDGAKSLGTGGMDVEGTGTNPMSTNIVLLLGTLFCTVAGYFAVQPMMAAALEGQGAASFATLHAVSGGLFMLKGLLVLALAWRLASR